MDSIKKFFANFQKHGTITWSLKKKVKVIENREILKEAKDVIIIDDLKTVHDDDGSKKQEFIDMTSKVFVDGSTKNSKINTNVGKTRQHLKEFDEVVKKRNIDNTELVTLDDVDEVLNEITEEPNVSTIFQTPRFDLQDLVDNFGLNFEQNDFDHGTEDFTESNPENIKFDEKIELMYIDYLFGSSEIDDIAETINIDDLLEQQNSDKDIVTINLDESIDSDEKDSMESGNTNGIPENNVTEVISISSEDSQSSETNLVINTQEISKLSEVKLENETDNTTTKEPNDKIKNLKYADFQFKYEIITDFNTDLEAKNKSNDDKLNVKQNNLMEQQDITGKVCNNNCNQGLNELSKDVLNICSKPNQSGSSANDNNNTEITFEEELSKPHYDKVLCTFDSKENKQDKSEILFKIEEPLNIISEIDNSYLNNDVGHITNFEIDEVNGENSKKHVSNIKFEEDYDSDDCGYISSDFEFITEEEAKLDGLIINFNPNVHKKNIGLNRVKTIDISEDLYSNKYPKSGLESVQINLKNNEVFRIPENVEQINLHTEDFANNPDNTINVHGNVKENPPTHTSRSLQENIIVTKAFEPNLQESYDQKYSYTSEKQENTVEQNDFESNSQVSNAERMNLRATEFLKSPDINNIKCHQPNILQAALNQRNGSTEDEIQRWRRFQRIRRDQFILDQSYRSTHYVPNRDESYQLFNPNFLPPLNPYRVENKSTLTSLMMTEYNGVGFDMRMMRGNGESEDEEVKEEAAACAKRILEMYPAENRKRRRRF